MSITSTKSKKIDKILSYLFDLNRFGIKVGLDHTIELLNRCRNPQNNFQLRDAKCFLRHLIFLSPTSIYLF